MNINPNALLFWGLAFLAGYLIGGTVQIGLWSLLGAGCVSLLITLFSKN